MKTRKLLTVAVLVLVIGLLFALPAAAQLPTTDELNMDWVEGAIQGAFWLFGLFIALISIAVSLIFGSRLVNAVIGFFGRYFRIGGAN